MDNPWFLRGIASDSQLVALMIPVGVPVVGGEGAGLAPWGSVGAGSVLGG
jgi:hypothetical protein